MTEKGFSVLVGNDVLSFLFNGVQQSKKRRSADAKKQNVHAINLGGKGTKKSRYREKKNRS
jgi:hypothetical protein